MDRSQPDGVANLAGPKASLGQATRAWLVHLFTVLGIVAGLQALVSVYDGHPRAAIGWLMVAAVIDGLDGPIARLWGVARTLPMIDGCILDVVVDFIGCVVVPLAFVWRFDMLPAGLNFAVVALAFVTAALWFSRTDLMTPDNWFNGFPTAWNLMVPTFFLVGTGTAFNAAFFTFLAVLQMTSVKFVHPVRVREGRRLTLVITVGWFAGIILFTATYPDVPWWGKAILAVGPCYQACISARRSLVEPAGLHLPAPQ